LAAWRPTSEYEGATSNGPARLGIQPWAASYRRDKAVELKFVEKVGGGLSGHRHRAGVLGVAIFLVEALCQVLSATRTRQCFFAAKVRSAAQREPPVHDGSRGTSAPAHARRAGGRRLLPAATRKAIDQAHFQGALHSELVGNASCTLGLPAAPRARLAPLSVED